MLQSQKLFAAFRAVNLLAFNAINRVFMKVFLCRNVVVTLRMLMPPACSHKLMVIGDVSSHRDRLEAAAVVVLVGKMTVRGVVGIKYGANVIISSYCS